MCANRVTVDPAGALNDQGGLSLRSIPEIMQHSSNTGLPRRDARGVVDFVHNAAQWFGPAFFRRAVDRPSVGPSAVSIISDAHVRSSSNSA